MPEEDSIWHFWMICERADWYGGMREDCEMGRADTKGMAGKVSLGVGCGLAAAAVGLLAVCWLLGIGSKADLVAYQEMSREQFPPVWKDLALRRFGLGSDVERLVTRHAPLHHDEAPPYARVVYVEGGR